MIGLAKRDWRDTEDKMTQDAAIEAVESCRFMVCREWIEGREKSRCNGARLFTVGTWLILLIDGFRLK